METSVAYMTKDQGYAENITAEDTNYRKRIIDLLIPYFKEDESFHLLVGDMGFGAIDKMKAEMPNRITNCGIMEQGMVGISAGMALSGMKPVVYSICNFLVYRALEQIRNDVILQYLNVKFIGTGAENYFSFLGKSHTCGRDDVDIMKMVGVVVYNPFDKLVDFETLVDQWIKKDRAGYIRV
jgi:transketolase